MSRTVWSFSPVEAAQGPVTSEAGATSAASYEATHPAASRLRPPGSDAETAQDAAALELSSVAAAMVLTRRDERS